MWFILLAKSKVQVYHTRATSGLPVRLTELERSFEAGFLMNAVRIFWGTYLTNFKGLGNFQGIFGNFWLIAN